MKVSVVEAPLKDLQVEALILAVGTGPLDERAREVDAATGGLVSKVLKSKTFKGKEEQVELLYPVSGLGAERLVLVGLGEGAQDAESWRRSVSAGLNELKGKAGKVAIALPAGLDAETAATATAESAVLSAYTFHPYRSKPDEDEIHLESLTIVGTESLSAAAERGVSLAQAVSWVRDLSNMPGNKLRVPDLVAEARELATSHKLTLRVVEGNAVEAEGFGLLAAVGRGSETPPAFVVLEYRGGGDAKPIVFVGKGVTFDTGGICIKPRAGMEEMKTDMHGAATVMGTLRVASERKLPVNLVGLLPIAENMPNGNAVTPGNVVKSYGGQTVEIIDTDAEGRLIMGDALGYAVKHYKPEFLIDIATLTGSIIIALAYEATGLFTNSDVLAKELSAAGEATGERYWRMPTWDAYAEAVQSPIADVRNVGKAKGDAIHAAKFLQSFVGDTPWAHLDIAGPSWISGDKPYRPKGSTGVGVRSLIHWLETRLAKA